MEYYVVTAVGSENITCDPTEDTFVHSCNISSDRNVNSFNFTVHSVTTGVDGVAYNGGALSDCRKLVRIIIMFMSTLFFRCGFP